MQHKKIVTKNKFEKGARVICKENRLNIPMGSKGIIRQVIEPSIGVEWDGRNNLHNLDGSIENNSGYYVESKYLAHENLVQEKYFKLKAKILERVKNG